MSWRYTWEDLFPEGGHCVEYEPFSYAGSSPHVPDEFRLDPYEHNCLGHADQLAELNPALTYVEGWARKSNRFAEWGAHAWCETADGEVVDPYFEWKFPGESITYHRAEPGGDPFGWMEPIGTVD